MGSLEKKSPSKKRLPSQVASPKALTSSVIRLVLQWKKVALLLALLSAGLFAALHILSHYSPTNYVLVMDAGSSGTRLYAYTWRPGAAAGDPPVVEVIPPEAAAAKVPRRAMPARRAYQRVETEPGLDRFVGDNKGLQSKSMGPLLRWAKAVVPRRHWQHTPVFLFATAGLRKLPDEQQEALMRGVRKALKLSRFRFEDSWARIISGEDEGVYGWIALNYLSGKFSSSSPPSSGSMHSSSRFLEEDTVEEDPQQAQPGTSGPHQSALQHPRGGSAGNTAHGGDTVGILDLGGSSLEVAFELEEGATDRRLHSEDTVNVTVFGHAYSLYVHVHHHYGLNDAFDRSVTLLLPPVPSMPSPLSPRTQPSVSESDRGSGEEQHSNAVGALGGASGKADSSGDSTAGRDVDPGSRQEAERGVNSGSTDRSAGSPELNAEGSLQESSGEVGREDVAHPDEPLLQDQASTSGDSGGTSGSEMGRKEDGRPDAGKDQSLQKGAGEVPLPRSREEVAGSAGHDESAGGGFQEHIDLPEEEARMAVDLAMHHAQRGQHHIALNNQQAQQPQQQVVMALEAEADGSRTGQGQPENEHSRRSLLQLLRTKKDATLSAMAGLRAWGTKGMGQLHTKAPPDYAAAIAQQLAAEEAASRPERGHTLLRPPEGLRRRHLMSRPGAVTDVTSGEKGDVEGGNSVHGDRNPHGDGVSYESPGLSRHDDAVQDAPGPRATPADSGAALSLLKVAHPCLHEGYAEPYTRLVIQGATPNPPQVMLVGRPDHDACARLAAQVVNASVNCGAPVCALGTPQPPSTRPFQALTGFYVVYHFFGLHSPKEMQRLEQVGRDFCGKPWAQVEAERANEIHVDRYCFRAPFVTALLGQGLSVEGDRVQIGRPDVGWTLGAALAEGSRLGVGASTSSLLHLSLSSQNLLHFPRLSLMGLTQGERLAVAAAGALLLVLTAVLARRKPGTTSPGKGPPRAPGLPLGPPSNRLDLIWEMRGSKGTATGFMPSHMSDRGLGSYDARHHGGGLGGMMAVPVSPQHQVRVNGGLESPPLSPIYQRFFGTPPKKRWEPPPAPVNMRGNGWGPPHDRGRLLREMPVAGVPRMSRAVSRRGTSVDDVNI